MEVHTTPNLLNKHLIKYIKKPFLRNILYSSKAEEEYVIKTRRQNTILCYTAAAATFRVFLCIVVEVSYNDTISCVMQLPLCIRVCKSI